MTNIDRSIRAGAKRYAGGAAVVLTLAMLVGWLAMRPVRGVSSAEECARAFEQAQSRTDSIAAALLSFPDPAGHQVPRRCGETLPSLASHRLP
jgi:hypothetical protein